MTEQTGMPIWLKEGKLVWIENRDQDKIEVLTYTMGVIVFIDYKQKQVKVKDSTGFQITVPGNYLLERNDKQTIVQDLGEITLLNDAELLKHLEIRYMQNPSYIHCFCGPTLIIINPYKLIEHEESMETKQRIIQYYKKKDLRSAPPHIWTIAARAMHELYTTQKDQAVCISGESGSGKTESTKRCLEFISNYKENTRMSVMQSNANNPNEVTIEQQILSCNPLLETFGNSKTLRNDNSSRFGKHTILHIDTRKKQVKGASIQNFLLEKSRITNISDDECSFHIFYALILYMDQENKNKYFIKDNIYQYKYLAGKNYLQEYDPSKVKFSVKYDEFYKDTIQSLEQLELTKEEQDTIFKVVSIVLNLGNLEINQDNYQEGKNRCEIVQSDEFNSICSLLNIDQETMNESLTIKELKVHQETTRSPLSPTKVKYTIDSLARALYEHMFNWLVKRLNMTLLPKNDDIKQLKGIGVLDIFGFEIFKTNSLEQLFINYANERLQGLYIYYIFKNECNIFIEEGLQEYTTLIKYTDNNELILALDNSKNIPGTFPGVLDLLDQTCNLNKDDKSFFFEISKIATQEGGNQTGSQYVKLPKFNKNMSFIIKHTAREVQYNPLNFIDKNKEELSTYLLNNLLKLNSPISQIILETYNLKIKEEIEEENEDNQQSKKTPTISQTFRSNMDMLINELSACVCQFVRCIKPNEAKQPQTWNSQLCLQQIRYMGMLDSLNVRKNSFPFRFQFEDFIKIYQDLDPAFNPKNFEDKSNREIAEYLIQSCKQMIDDKAVLFGQTKIFLTEKAKVILDDNLKIKQEKKREKIDLIAQLYKNYCLRKNITKFISSQFNKLKLARYFLESFKSTLAAQDYKLFRHIVFRLQIQFKVKQRRKRFKELKTNALFISKYLALYKLYLSIKNSKKNYKSIIIINSLFCLRNKIENYNMIRNQITNMVQNVIQITYEKQRQQYSSLLQNTIRSFLIRKNIRSNYGEIIDQLETLIQNQKAIVIQKNVRGYLQRQKYLNIIYAATCIQSYMRMYWCKQYYKKLKKKTIIIQREVRKYLNRLHDIQKQEKIYLTNYEKQFNNNIIMETNNFYQNVSTVNKKKFEIEGVNFIPIQIKENENRKLLTSFNDTYDKKCSLFLIPIYLQIHNDTQQIYPKTFSLSLFNFLYNQTKQNNQLINIELNDDSILVINDKKQIYQWGLNDQYQCNQIPTKEYQENSNQFKFVQEKLNEKQLSLLNPISVQMKGKKQLLLDSNGNVFITQFNEKQQMPQINLLDKNSFLTQDICSYNNLYYLLDTNNNLWQLNGDNKIKQDVQLTKINIKEQQIISQQQYKHKITYYYPELKQIRINDKVLQIQTGNDFTIFLTKKGRLYSFGNNKYGQLGLGHNNAVSSPQVIESLIKLVTGISDFQIGFSHVLLLSSAKQLFAWGCNYNGQLGTGDTISYNKPTKINIINKNGEILSIAAGFNQSYLLTNNNQLMVSGKSNDNKENINTNHLIFRAIDYSSQFNYLIKQKNIKPVRIISQHSKLLTLLNVQCIDYRNNEDLIKYSSSQLDKFISQVNQQLKNNGHLILPKQNEFIKNHFNYSYYIKSFDNKVNIPLYQSGQNINKQMNKEQTNDNNEFQYNDTTQLIKTDQGNDNKYKRVSLIEEFNKQSKNENNNKYYNQQQEQIKDNKYKRVSLIAEFNKQQKNENIKKNNNVQQEQIKDNKYKRVSLIAEFQKQQKAQKETITYKNNKNNINKFIQLQNPELDTINEQLNNDIYEPIPNRNNKSNTIIKRESLLNQFINYDQQPINKKNVQINQQSVFKRFSRLQ